MLNQCKLWYLTGKRYQQAPVQAFKILKGGFLLEIYEVHAEALEAHGKHMAVT